MHTCFANKQWYTLLPGRFIGDLTEEITFDLKHKGKVKDLNLSKGVGCLNRQQEQHIPGAKRHNVCRELQRCLERMNGTEKEQKFLTVIKIGNSCVTF